MRGQKQGFTLLEIVVAVVIMTVLAGFIVPMAQSYINSSRAARIITIAERLKEASLRFYHDTNNIPIEDSGEPGTPDLDPASHHLSMDVGETGLVQNWDGPYIDRPLALADNSYGKQIALVREPGNPSGQVLWLVYFGPNEQVAKLVDEKFDQADANWQTSGDVLYDDSQANREFVKVRLLKKD